MDYAAAVEVFFTLTPDHVGTPQVVATATAARRLRDALEPIAMHDVWSAHVNAAMAERGLDFFPAYVVGRAAPLGDVSGAVVAATFGVFEPATIRGMWDEGCAALSPKEMIALRDRATAESLRADIGTVAPEAEVGEVAAVLERAIEAVDSTGRPLFAALRAQPRLSDPYARLWRAADTVREHRGDSHIAASIAAGLDPVRMGVLSEVWVDYPVGEYSGTRAWPQDAYDAAVARLVADGLIADGKITAAGREFRDAIEAATDTAQDELIAAIGDGLDGVVKRVEPWAQQCIAAGSFPPDIRKRAAG
jgi:Helix-turn-helix family